MTSPLKKTNKRVKNKSKKKKKSQNTEGNIKRKCNHRNMKDHKRLLGITICQQAGQCRKNGYIPKNIQPTNTE